MGEFTTHYDILEKGRNHIILGTPGQKAHDKSTCLIVWNLNESTFKELYKKDFLIGHALLLARKMYGE